MREKSNISSSHIIPKVSIVSPSLNTARFLRNTIESIMKQTFTDYEYIVIDGESTDETIDILKEYPQIKWVSEKEEGDNGILDAIWKGFYMSKGQYFTYICISDGFSDKNWLKKSVEVLDSDSEVSAVWGIHQEISENGHLGKVAWPEYLGSYPPPQKMDFLPFWLACRQDIEIATIFRRNVFEKCYPKNEIDEIHRFSPHCALNYNFHTRGYMAYFLPYLAFYARTHKNQRQEQNYDVLDVSSKRYNKDIKEYRKNVFSGKVSHCFRDSNSNIIKKVSKADLKLLKKKYFRHRLNHKLRKYFEKFMEHI